VDPAEADRGRQCLAGGTEQEDLVWGGEGLGLLGLVAGVPAVIALPAGVWLAGHHLAAAAAALAATAGLLPLAAIRWLPGGREPRRSARAGRMPGARGSGWMTGGALRLPLIFAAATVAALGMAVMMALGSPVVIFAGMAAFGAGFGVIENATFALLIEQLPEAKASAWWNFAYDAGYGAGPAVFGLICVAAGYPAAFALTSALILAAIPAAVRERKAVASVARPA
jgi:hypothetical protein